MPRRSALYSSQPYSGWLRRPAVAAASNWPRSALSMATRMAARWASRVCAPVPVQASSRDAAKGSRQIFRFIGKA